MQLRQRLADSVGIVALVGEQSIDPVRDHAHERAEALDVVRLSGRQHESERAAFSIAPGVELGRELASRPVEAHGLLSP
jgi:hypothetical protein